LIDCLNAKFVNSWVMLSQLEKPDTAFSTADGRARAKAVLKKYDYPVQTQVLSPQGDLLAELPVMANFSTTPGKPGGGGPSPYWQSLDKALEAMKSK
jgi:hypothetical protein